MVYVVIMALGFPFSNLVEFNHHNEFQLAFALLCIWVPTWSNGYSVSIHIAFSVCALAETIYKHIEWVVVGESNSKLSTLSGCPVLLVV